MSFFFAFSVPSSTKMPDDFKGTVSLQHSTNRNVCLTFKKNLGITLGEDSNYEKIMKSAISLLIVDLNKK